MASRRRHLHRRKSFSHGNGLIAIRVGSRRAPRNFYEVQLSGARDTGRFARLIEDQVHAFPRDPLVIAVNGYQPWLEDVFNSCIQDFWSDISDLDREVQFAGTMQFPERGDSRGPEKPWTFLIDHMNVPQVYYWSVGMEPPVGEDEGLPDIDKFRFRVGVWQMGRGACVFDREVSVTIIFTRPTPVCDHVVTELLFWYLVSIPSEQPVSSTKSQLKLSPNFMHRLSHSIFHKTTTNALLLGASTKTTISTSRAKMKKGYAGYT